MFDKETAAEQERIRQHRERLKKLSRPFSLELDKRRKYHPSSKVGFIPLNGMGPDDWETAEGKQTVERLKIMKEKESEYKLGIL